MSIYVTALEKPMVQQNTFGNDIFNFNSQEKIFFKIILLY